MTGRAARGRRTPIREYLDAMVGFIGWLRGQGYDVRLLIGDLHYDVRVTEDVVAALRGRSGDEGEVLADPAQSVEQLVRQLSTTELVISPRFHNLVLALALHKPVIALSDHPKLDSLVASFGMSDYRLPLETVDVDGLIALFQRLRDDAERLKARIREQTEEYRQALDERYDAAFAKVAPLAGTMSGRCEDFRKLTPPDGHERARTAYGGPCLP